MWLRSLLVGLTCVACQATSGSAPQGGPPPQDAPAPVASAPAPSGDLRVLSLQLGMRQFDEDDWAPVEDQAAFALDFAYQSAGAVLGFEGGLGMSATEEDAVLFDGTNYFDVTVESSFLEFYGGLHMSFHPSPTIRPFVGAGVTYLSYNLDLSGDLGGSDDDSSFGFYAHGGVGVRLNEMLELGADFRAVMGTDFESSGLSYDADYTQLAVFVGFHL